ncbi:hypothetical protein H353_05008 [Streptococcus oralis subsp. tigurinus 1366]|uniref:Uncharacterized protein n=1 Tax=Streptococcus oralis subsp. tigurinus 2426 TaxID=1333865 RepID=S9REV4_STROR|nr:hypothetical protein H353_05008 [Streptococcus oralis subsp. tigurinus 1366]EPX88830.1 hypothetical protein L697_04660 [Streptococcus oralis subsp. tigurinus 2425]EPX90422.1 hypothetical protein L698_04030 [Streptococcus oralis subsp. tigurinus 2426]
MSLELCFQTHFWFTLTRKSAIILARKESLMAFFKRAWGSGSQVEQGKKLALSVVFLKTMK